MTSWHDCPVCGSSETSVRHQHTDPDHIAQTLVCACGAVWTLKYTVTDETIENNPDAPTGTESRRPEHWTGQSGGPEWQRG